MSEMSSRELTGWMMFFELEKEQKDQPKQEDPAVLSEKIKLSLIRGK